MQDTISEDSPFKPVEFKTEMPVAEWEKVKSVQHAITHAEQLFDRVDEKPIAAGVLSEMVIGEYPEETKMEVFEKAASLIDNSKEFEANKEVAKVLIEMITAQKDRGMMFRLAAIISHQLQDKYFDYRENDFSSKHYDEFNAKKTALQLLANDKSAGQDYADIASFLLVPKPGSILELYNGMYRRGMDLVINPKIEEEIADEDEVFEYPDSARNEGTKFTGNLMKLNPFRIPTREKIEKYKEVTGRDLPYFIVRKTGGRLFMVEFPRGLIEKTDHLARSFRNNTISKKQAFDQLSDLGLEFLDMMNEEQRSQFLDPNVNIEIRFSTERSESAENVNRVDVITGEQDNLKSAA